MAGLRRQALQARRGRARRCDSAKLISRALHNDAANCDDDEERKAIAKWARLRKPSRGPRRGVPGRERASGDRSGADLDADPWTFNTLTGTIDLRVGELAQASPRRPADEALAGRGMTLTPRVRAGGRSWQSIFGDDEELSATCSAGRLLSHGLDARGGDRAVLGLAGSTARRRFSDAAARLR